MHGKNLAKHSTSLLDPVGDIFATYSVLMGIRGQSAFDDAIWSDYRERVPEIGTKVSAIIAS